MDFLVNAYDDACSRWMERFSFSPPAANPHGTCSARSGPLPTFTVIPASQGPQIVRNSLPFPAGAFPTDQSLTVQHENQIIEPDIRILTVHPGQPVFVRRAILTFPFVFQSDQEHGFQLQCTSKQPAQTNTLKSYSSPPFRIELNPVEIFLTPDQIQIHDPKQNRWTAKLLCPERNLTGMESPETSVRFEIIERGNHFIWARLLVWDAAWPRIIEVKLDSMGTAAVQAHLQRLEPGDRYAPLLGWHIEGPPMIPDAAHFFVSMQLCRFQTPDNTFQIYFPIAPLKQKGTSQCLRRPAGSAIRYLRSTGSDFVPFQSASWRRMEFVLSGTQAAVWNSHLEPSHTLRIPASAMDAIYDSGEDADLSPWPILEQTRRHARDMIIRSSLRGDDLGYMSGYHPSSSPPVSGPFRFSHAPSVFEQYYRTTDLNLRTTVLLWCENVHELCIWWGDADDFGGSRYRNANRLQPDPFFMWRKNSACDFGTKGFDSFFHAWEETGDPRMATALRVQIQYALNHIHIEKGGQTRNIGTVSDWIRLYRFTGIDAYREKALGLFRELRPLLSEKNLFDQEGEEIQEQVPFIEDTPSPLRFEAGFAKPYIIGYGLNGLPALAKEYPVETRLYDTVRSLAFFLADSQDPLGAWRYPHPKSPRILISLAGETAMQIARGAEIIQAHGEESIEPLCDAIERTLRLYAVMYDRSGSFAGRLGGWEKVTAGLLNKKNDIYHLYSNPEDRNSSRDYMEGPIAMENHIDGFIHLYEAIDFYLRHRSANCLQTFTPEQKQFADRLSHR